MADELSQESIQRIQSFLSGEEAARTAIVSRSWYAAWSTRPDLLFKQCLFRRFRDDFSELTKKTMQRYEDLNLKIHSLRLSISKLDDASVSTDLMLRALKLGAFDLDFTHWDGVYLFPTEALRSETLTTLTLVGFFQIDLQNLDCSKIKSLTLSMDVKFDLFNDLLPRFPLLETLKFDGQRLMCRYEGEIGNLGSRKINLGFDTVHHRFEKLEYLYLGDFVVKGSLFASASALSEFPSLKELVIWNCRGLKDIRICSGSLERVSVWLEEERKRYVTEFDVPNIRKFMFEGCGWARLDLKTSSTEWESDIHLTYGHLRSEWFIWLDELVEKLRASKVCVAINVTEEMGGWSGAVRWGPHVVENLTLDGCVVMSPAFLDSLFSICRPKLLIREYNPPCDPVHEYLLELVCKGMLEKVNVELHPRKPILEHGWKLVRFRLTWPSTK